MTYVSVEPRLAPDAFSLAALVCTETFFGRSWIVLDGTLDSLVDLSNGPSIESESITLPDIFIGNKEAKEQIASLPEKEKRGLKDLITEGICMLRCFLRAGYHVRKNRAPVPGWAVQTRSRWLSLITGAFSITSGEYDRTVQESFMESSSMRKLMCDATMRVLSNYFYYIFSPGGGIDFEGMLAFALAADARRGAESDFENPYLFPYSEHHRNIVAWHSPNVWDEIYKIYVSSDRV